MTGPESGDWRVVSQHLSGVNQGEKPTTPITASNTSEAATSYFVPCSLFDAAIKNDPVDKTARPNHDMMNIQTGLWRNWYTQRT